MQAVAGWVATEAAGVAVAVARTGAHARAAAVAEAGAVAEAAASASYKLSVGDEGRGGVPAGGWSGTSSMLKNLCMLFIISTNEGRS